MIVRLPSKTKYTSLVIALLVHICLSSYGQEAVDYFCPSKQFTRAFYYTPNQSGAPTGMTTEKNFYWTPNGFEIETIAKLDGKLGKYERCQYVATRDAIRIVSSSVVNLQGDYFQDYDQPQAVFMMPKATGPTAWTMVDNTGQKIDYVSEWSTIVVEGVQEEVVKITETITLSTGRVFAAKRVSYYVKGTGLWRSDGETENERATIIAFDHFE
jgi:hypothetical protein